MSQALLTKEQERDRQLFECAPELENYRPLLPVLFSLDGEPFDLIGRELFEPLFAAHRPRRWLGLFGRQTGKTRGMSSLRLLECWLRPGFTSLSINPLYETTRRYSQNYVQPMLEQSPIAAVLYDRRRSNNILQKTMRNGSTLYFSYAGADPTRIRGMPSYLVHYDEIQDLDLGVIPIINQVTSAGKYGVDFSMYTGTAKTLDHPSEIFWAESSQATWIIHCDGCGKWNLANTVELCLKMIGPAHEDIGPKKPGLICMHCERPVNPRRGYWYHEFPDRRRDFPGYRAPQIFFPFHCEDAENWAMLVDKATGGGGFTQAKFANEVLAISSDVGARVLSLLDVRRAARLGPNTLEAARARRGEYDTVCLGIDWGGGGDPEDEAGMITSWTTVAALGTRAGSEKVEVFYGYRSLTPHDFADEAKRIAHVAGALNVDWIAHDFAVAGANRAAMLIQSGVPARRIVNFAYTNSPRQKVVVWKKPSVRTGREGYYLIDKSRTIYQVFHAIKAGLVEFFDYDFINTGRPGLLYDLMGIIEDRRTTGAGDYFALICAKGRTDDFAHSVNLGAWSLWLKSRKIPRVSAALIDRYRTIDEIPEEEDN